MVRGLNNRYREYRVKSRKHIRERNHEKRRLAHKRSLANEQAWQHAYEFDSRIDFENIRNVSLNID